MQNIIPCLCFNDQAKQAATFHTSLFEDARIVTVTRWGEQELAALARVPEAIRPGPAGAVRSVTFELFGQQFLTVNGGGHFTFNNGISLMVQCETQQALDALWQTLADGGQEIECGWLTDRFGVSWQVIPTALEAMANDPDPEKSQRVRAAVLQMKKFDIAAQKQAYEGHTGSSHDSDISHV